jgi:Gas vesicle synthesis protein GvpL/GvpF
MADGDELRRQLRHLVAEHDDEVNRLIADAREEAVARVRSLLVQAYTDVLLERVHDELASRATGGSQARTDAPHPAETPSTAEVSSAAEAPPLPQAPPPSQGATPQTGELGWYVYCVVSDDHAMVPDDLAGIDPNHSVAALRRRDVAAIVSRVPLAEFGEEPLREHLSDMEWLERTARRHEHVVDEIARAATPIPMRLCSIYRDETGVRDMLERENDALRQALAHLRGKVEWGVKAFADVEAAAPDSSPQPTVLGSGEGAAYLHNRLTQRRGREDVRERLAGAAEMMHAALCAVAVEGVTSPPQRPEVSGHDEPMIFNGSYLVADGDADTFHRELACLEDELAPLGVTVQATGPWPPYNFVPGTIGAAW